MTDPAIIAASYNAEKSYTHNLDNVIDPSGAVGAWGTTKESTTELVDLSGNSHIAAIKDPMPTEGFIQGRRYDGDDDFLDCGIDASLQHPGSFLVRMILSPKVLEQAGLFSQDSSINIFLRPGGDCMFSIGNTVPGWAFTQAPLSNKITVNTVHVVEFVYTLDENIKIYLNGVNVYTLTASGAVAPTTLNLKIGIRDNVGILENPFNGLILYTYLKTGFISSTESSDFFNALARLPFWSVNYTDYPDNSTEYTDNLPYSSSIISSGTFKVDSDKLQCVSAGTIEYGASYKFDGSEFIVVNKGLSTEFSGTGTATSGTISVSVSQDSNKITIVMSTGDTINGIDIQFRKEV